MNASTKNEPDLAVLQDDMAALKRDVASLIDHLKTGASSGAHNAAEYLGDGAQRLYRTMAAESQRSAKAVGEKVEEHPLAAILIALGVGYIGGRLLSR